MVTDARGLCAYHLGDYETESWSDGNRIMCDFFHRGVVPARLALADRTDPVCELTVA